MTALINKKALALLCLLLGWIPCLAAQTGEMTEEDADLIRLDENTVYGEAFVREAPADEAAAIDLHDAALASLTESANEIRDAHGISPVSPGRLHPFVKYFTYATSGRVCGFAYLPLQKVLSISADSPSVSPAQPPAAPPVAPSSPSPEPPAPSEPSSSTPPASTSPAAPASPAVTPGQSGGSSSSSPSVPQSPSPTASSAYSPNSALDVVTEILYRRGLMLDELGRLLTEGKRKGTVIAFGQVRPGNPIPTDCYLAVVDRSLKVVTLLAPEGAKLPDTLPFAPLPPTSSASEFHNCGFVWFK